MKTELAILLINLIFINISVATDDESTVATTSSTIEKRGKLDKETESKFLKEIEDEGNDPRPQVIQDLENELVIKGSQFSMNRIKEFKDNPSKTNDNEEPSSKNELTEFDKFILFVNEIEDSNQELYKLMDKLKETMSTNKIEKTPIDMIPIISQTLISRVKVVTAINWMGMRVNYSPDKAGFMSIREDLVKLKEVFNSIEYHLLSINDKVSNPKKIKKMDLETEVNYLQETITEKKNILLTNEVINKIKGLEMKPGRNNCIDRIYYGDDDLPLNISFDEIRGHFILLRSTIQHIENILVLDDDNDNNRLLEEMRGHLRYIIQDIENILALDDENDNNRLFEGMKSHLRHLRNTIQDIDDIHLWDNDNNINGLLVEMRSHLKDILNLLWNDYNRVRCGPFGYDVDALITFQGLFTILDDNE